MQLTLWEKLATLRRRQGMSMEEVAAKAGLSRGTYRAIEVAETSPRLDQLDRICEALGVGLDVAIVEFPPELEG